MILAQAAPPVFDPAPLFPWFPVHGLPGTALQQELGSGALALILLLMLFLALRPRRKEVVPKTPPPSLPAEKIQVQLPPSAEEAAKVQQAQDARAQAEALARERRQVSDAVKAAADEAERTRLGAEARKLKEREEEAKREEYRARKAAERETKDRHEREREEEVRLQAELAAKAQEEAAVQARASEEADQKRVAAQAGQTLAQGLDKTKSQGFMAKLNSMFGAPRAVDESVLADLEEVLFTADIGVKTASSLVAFAREKVKKNELANVDKIKGAIRGEVEKILSLPIPGALQGGGPPHVVMVVGVNGAGKTTTIGKLAAQLTQQGKKVVLAAGDTFRAAAAEQLDVWADRAHAQLVKGPDGGDPGAVIFDAIKRAKEIGADVVIADTAGRLHTKAPLMEELKKVRRVMDKALPGAPHEVLLVLDATNGQNAIAQAKQFQESVGITGIALTKLDGTAKGGVIIGICDELKIPVLWVGVGEKVPDLRRFDPKEFVSALFD